jgi:hypothetical protein
MKKLKMPPAVLEFFQKTGAEGGKARKARHTPDELRAWGKLGGRPVGAKDKQPRQRTTKGAK